MGKYKTYENHATYVKKINFFLLFKIYITDKDEAKTSYTVSKKISED